MRAWERIAARSLRAATSTAIGVGLAVSVQPAGAELRTQLPVPLVVEAAHCGAGDAAKAPVSGAVVGQTIRVSVPRTAIVDVDDTGGVLTAGTNTGCRPAPGDDLYIRRPNGTIEPAPTGAFAGATWRGDFTRGLGRHTKSR